MSDRNPSPEWYTPGGTTTAPRHAEPGPSGTAPIPVQAWSATPPSGPFGPLGQQPGGPQGPSGARQSRTAEITAVAVLAALLSSGGTVAASRLWADDTQTASTTSTSDLRRTDAAPVSQADASAPDWSATAAAVSPSVVSIMATTSQSDGQGSGVVIDTAGNVLTNNHVVSGAEQLSVTLADGRTYEAEIRGTDPSTDLAVITLSDPPQDLKPIAVGDSDALEVGDPVMAVGNPLGLAGTVTTGIVSALNRPVSTQGESNGQGDPFGQGQAQAEPVVTNAIQTSAAINPGNSGGALVNAGGQLVGINSSIASVGSSGGQSGNIGIGFAIPVNEATSVASQLIESGSVAHAFLGVTPQDGSASDGSATRTGAEVVSVGDGTPAAEAGLRAGDVVTAVDGERVESALSLVGQIRERTVGDKVTLTVLRDGGTTEVQVTLAARSATDG